MGFGVQGLGLRANHEGFLLLLDYGIKPFELWLNNIGAYIFTNTILRVPCPEGSEYLTIIY